MKKVIFEKSGRTTARRFQADIRLARSFEPSARLGVALLAKTRDLIDDFKVKPDSEISRELEDFFGLLPDPAHRQE